MNKNLYSLGLMSGTSMDGIDASIIKSDGEQFLEIIDDIYLEYDDQLKSELKKVIDSCSSKEVFKKLSNSINDLENKITLKHSQACKLIIEKNRNIKVDLIGFHGQTVLHKPQEKYSIQIGDSQLLSRLTNTTVVSNFRLLSYFRYMLSIISRNSSPSDLIIDASIPSIDVPLIKPKL